MSNLAFPAARIGDPITHDDVVASGVVGPPTPTPCPQCATNPVFIEGMPAAHAGMSCVCSGATSVAMAHTPPPPGAPPVPIATGSATVLIHGMPASRWIPSGDSGACGVFIGDAKLAVTRTVVIGGPSVVPGYPRAIAQRDGTIVTEYSPAITISGTPEFRATVVARLKLIATTRSGSIVIQRINHSGKAMNIIEYTGNNSFCGANPNWDDVAGQTPLGKPVFDGTGNPVMDRDRTTQLLGTGEGANTTLRLNPNLVLKNNLAAQNPFRNDMVLMHEMTHGAHQMNGEADMSPVGEGWRTQEERTTISDGDPSEADYLKERGYPYHRTDHDLTFARNETGQ
jgi:uncharacterized Zn-binding protein involved in type VI secretion